MFGRFRRLFTGEGKEANYNAFNDAFFSMFGLSTTTYDQGNKTYVDKGYSYNPDVYAIVKQIATKCSDIPCNVKKVKDKKSLSKLQYIKTSTSYNQILKKAKLEMAAFEDEDMPMPLESPNPQQSWGEFIALSAVFMKLTGNCFWYILKPQLRENAEPTAIYCLPAHQIYLVLKDNPEMLGIESPIDYYKLIDGNQYVEFPAEQVIHIKNSNPNFDMNGGHLYGQSDLKAALRNIQSSNNGIDNSIKTMQNGGAFGFIHSKGAHVMTQQQAEAIKDRLKEMDKSPERLSKIAGVSAELGFTRISLTTDELKPFDYLNYDQKAIANVLGWSVKLLNNNDDASGLNNGAMNQERKRVITDTIMPLLKQFEEAFNSYFLPQFKATQGSVIEFDHTELPEMQEDMEKLSKWADSGVDGGKISRDEWRVIMKFPPKNTPEMQAHTVSINTISLEDALVPLENDLTITDDN